MASFPIHGLCPYDLRTVPLDVVATTARAHPHHLHGTARQVNPTYTPPEVLVPSVSPSVELPADPTMTLRLRTPSDMTIFRSALSTAAAESALADDELDAFVVAVFEVVTNALLHRIICSVTDAGPGFDDPLMGLLPPDDGAGGPAPYGLWPARQLCDHVTVGQTDEGFSVRLDLLAG